MTTLTRWLPPVAAAAAALLAIVAGSASAKYTTTQSPYSLPAPDQYNTAPSCPVSATNPYCTWSTEPTWDSANPEGDAPPYLGSSNYFTNCAYWAAEKRPDIEQLAVQVYGYSADGGGAAAWYPDAVKAGYPVDHTPTVGSIAVWAPPYGSHVAYVQQVNSDGSIVITEMDLQTDQYPNGVGATEYESAEDVTGNHLWFIHLKPATPMAPKVKITRKRQTVSLTVSIAPGSGKVTGAAVSGKLTRKLKLHQVSSTKLAATAKLRPGRWTLWLWYKPAVGFSSPSGYMRTLKIPSSKH